MDFSQYLDQYLKAKQVRGLAPSRKEATNLFSPYFESRQNLDALLKHIKLKEQEQEAKEKHWGESLAWDKEKAINTLAAQRDIAAGGNASQLGIATGRNKTTLDIATANNDWKTRTAADNLAFDMYKNSLLMDAAGKGDRNTMWGNIFSSLGSIGSGLLLNKYWK